MSGFNFSAAGGGGTAGFSFGQTAAATTTTGGSSAFSFSNPATTVASSGFSFGLPTLSATSTAPTMSTPAAAPTAVTITSAPTLATTTPAPAFNFNTGNSAASSNKLLTGMNMGMTANPAPATGSFNFASALSAAATTTTTAPATGFQLGAPAAAAATTAGFSFATKPLATLGTSITPASPASNTGFAFAAKIPATTTPTPATTYPGGFSFNTQPLAVPASTATNLSFPVSTTNPLTGLSSSQSTTATSTTGSLGGGGFICFPTPGTGTTLTPVASSTSVAPPTGIPLLANTSAPATLASVTTTTNSGLSGPSTTSTLSVRLLEERHNKWMLELKEQEERFVLQAAHINSWDQVLQQGHDQVQSLKDTLFTVKSDQARLEAELDFIRGQQEELERLLEPLEAAVTSSPASQHQGDRQRDNMYHLAQNLDAQLRQMSDDLCKVIEHLNGNASGTQPSDPVSLVARILSAHMDTLKWVDQNAALLSQKVDEVSRSAEARRRD